MNWCHERQALSFGSVMLAAYDSRLQSTKRTALPRWLWVLIERPTSTTTSHLLKR
jgi:hypothetical protein